MCALRARAHTHTQASDPRPFLASEARAFVSDTPALASTRKHRHTRAHPHPPPPLSRTHARTHATGSSDPTDCTAVAGSFGPAGAAAAPCPAGSFCPAGSESPTPCPVGTNSPDAAADLLQCKVRAGRLDSEWSKIDSECG